MRLSTMLRRFPFYMKVSALAFSFLLLNSALAFYALGATSDPVLESKIEGIGYLDIQGSDFCNTVYIKNSDLALTNHHCVPDHATCQDTQASFDINGVILSFPCEGIISKGNHKDGPHSDYTLMRLGGDPQWNLNGLPLASGDSIRKGEKYTVVRIKYDPPMGMGLHPKLQYVHCYAELDSKQKNAWKLTDIPNEDTCHNVKGNSGGVVLNQDYQIVGLASQIHLKEGKLAVDQFNDFHVEYSAGPSLPNILDQVPQLEDFTEERP